MFLYKKCYFTNNICPGFSRTPRFKISLPWIHWIMTFLELKERVVSTTTVTTSLTPLSAWLRNCVCMCSVLLMKQSVPQGHRTWRILRLSEDVANTTVPHYCGFIMTRTTLTSRLSATGPVHESMCAKVIISVWSYIHTDIQYFKYSKRFKKIGSISHFLIKGLKHKT